MFWHFLKSLRIITQVNDSIAKMSSQVFCKKTNNILRQREPGHVVEIRSISCLDILFLKSQIVRVAGKMLDCIKVEHFLTEITKVTSTCRRVMLAIGFPDLSVETDLRSAFTFIRKTCLLLDIASISYAGSHCFRFNTPGFNSSPDPVEVSDGEDAYAFKCSWKRLACLDAFLDRRKVLVFHLFDRTSKTVERKQDMESPSHMLARMHEIADIWGPVYTVPSKDGLIRYYGASKGVICRVKSNPRCVIPGAIQCHYFSRSSFVMYETSKLLPRGEKLLLAEHDLLMIGGGLRETQNCKYSISAYKEDNASDITVLGTSESVWKLDTRGLAAGVAKVLVITMSGTQKLVPQTSVKEHILDKWSTNPARANPGVLNQFLAVEISHCTGISRRICLRYLMTLNPIWSVLELRDPGWTTNAWGRELSAALRGVDDEAIFHVWKRFASQRHEMANLVCSTLELLDLTGRTRHGKFQAALLHQNDESAVYIDREINDWTKILDDTPLTAVYALVNERCLDCWLPDHSGSSCHISEAFTVLETEVASQKALDQGNNLSYTLMPCGQNLRRVADLGHIIPVFESDLMLSVIVKFKDLPNMFELSNRTQHNARNLIFFRASRRGFQGKKVPKPARVDAHQRSMLEMLVQDQ